MKASLKPGLTHRFAYTVPENKTVPFTYPEAPEIQAMPKIFATGFMVVSILVFIVLQGRSLLQL